MSCGPVAGIFNPRRELRVVEWSSIAFETDLPPSSRAIHPSGVLHASRSAPTAHGNIDRDEHAFAWIEDLIHVEAALAHLEKRGFDRSNGIVFIPYSSQRNWLERYPHAAPGLVCTGDGEVVVVAGKEAGTDFHCDEDADATTSTSRKRNAVEAHRPDAKDLLGRPGGAKRKKWAHFTPVELDGESSKNYALFEHPDGVRRRAPPDWKFYRETFKRMYHLWHCGDEVRKMFPIKTWHTKDVETMMRPWIILSEIRRLMGSVDASAAEHGAPPQRVMTHAEVERCFDAGKVAVNSITKMGGGRNLDRICWATAVKHLVKEVPVEGASPLEVTGELAEKQEGSVRIQSVAARAVANGGIGSSRLKEDGPPGYHDGEMRRVTKKIQPMELSPEMEKKYDLFEYPDGVKRRAPPDWQGYEVKFKPMYIMWHCGDDDRRIPPIKSWHTKDVDALPMKGACNLLSNTRRLMRAVDALAAKNGVPPHKVMTRADAESCFNVGKGVVHSQTGTGRGRNVDMMSIGTAVKNAMIARPHY